VNSCLKSHRFPIGNLYQSRFHDIWAGARQNFFREKANVCEKSDPFFRLIGNDPDTKVSGCLKSCDDIGRNLVIDNRMRALSPAKRAILRAAKLYYDVTGRAISPDHPLPARIGPPWRQPPDAQAADAPPTRRATAAPTPAHAPASPGVSLPAFPAVASGAGS
ncbi:MAG: hypothetical protein HY719_03615, partial [Planctomycetes bacterium]|nr:hypothetical protein [Planctomycetota bacterium]